MNVSVHHLEFGDLLVLVGGDGGEGGVGEGEDCVVALVRGSKVHHSLGNSPSHHGPGGRTRSPGQRWWGGDLVAVHGVETDPARPGPPLVGQLHPVEGDGGLLGPVGGRGGAGRVRGHHTVSHAPCSAVPAPSLNPLRAETYNSH